MPKGIGSHLKYKRVISTFDLDESSAAFALLRDCELLFLSPTMRWVEVYLNLNPTPS